MHCKGRRFFVSPLSPLGGTPFGTMNNGLITERALRGVFTTPSYISIGDDYAKKSLEDPRLKGKQVCRIC